MPQSRYTLHIKSLQASLRREAWSLYNTKAQGMHHYSFFTRSKQEGRSRNAGVIVLVLTLLLIGGVLLPGCTSDAETAQRLEETGDMAGAVAVYQAALQKDPDDVHMLALLGADLMYLGRYDEALPVQEKTVSLDKKDAQTRIELGFNYLNHQNRPADAVRVMAEAAALGKSAQTLTFLAQAQAANGNPQEAEASMREALAVDPTYPRSYDLLLTLLKQQGRSDEAAQIAAQAQGQGLTLSVAP